MIIFKYNLPRTGKVLEIAILIVLISKSLSSLAQIIHYTFSPFDLCVYMPNFNQYTQTQNNFNVGEIKDFYI